MKLTQNDRVSGLDVISSCTQKFHLYMLKGKLLHTHTFAFASCLPKVAELSETLVPYPDCEGKQWWVHCTRKCQVDNHSVSLHRRARQPSAAALPSPWWRWASDRIRRRACTISAFASTETPENAHTLSHLHDKDYNQTVKGRVVIDTSRVRVHEFCFPRASKSANQSADLKHGAWFSRTCRNRILNQKSLIKWYFDQLKPVDRYTEICIGGTWTTEACPAFNFLIIWGMEGRWTGLVLKYEGL